MKYYNVYLNNIAQDPKDEYIDDVQNAIDESWGYSTQHFKMERQIVSGGDEWESVDISVDNAIDVTTGQKKSSNYKKFNYRKLQSASTGTLFFWQDKYWLSTNVEKYGNVFSTMLVQKCNNVARFKNTKDGTIYQEPCILTDIGSTTPTKDKDIIVPNSTMKIIMQNNKKTKHIKLNTRLIFDGRPFVVTSILGMSRENDYEADQNLASFSLQLSNELATDDIINNIADGDSNVYDISIVNAPTSVLKSSQGQIVAIITKDGLDTPLAPKYRATNKKGKINANGVYTVLGDKGTMNISITYGSIVKKLSIPIVEEIIEKKIVITPNINEIRQRDEVTLVVNYYINGEVVEREIDYTINENDKKYIKITQKSNNEFIVTGNLVSKSPIDITFSCEESTINTQIKVLSLF